MLVIPATILGAMTTASSSLSALVKNTPSLSYAAAGMSLVLTILTALHTSLNVSPPSILPRGACSSRLGRKCEGVCIESELRVCGKVCGLFKLTCSVMETQGRTFIGSCKLRNTVDRVFEEDLPQNLQYPHDSK
jgi:hypothetical protein